MPIQTIETKCKMKNPIRIANWIATITCLLITPITTGLALVAYDIHMNALAIMLTIDTVALVISIYVSIQNLINTSEKTIKLKAIKHMVKNR